MDLESGLIGAIITAICIFPFVIMYYNRVKKEKKTLEILQKTAQEQNCNIHKHEFCGDFVLGLDDKQKIVFFLKKKKEKTISQFVNLNEIQLCKIVKQSRGSNNGAGNTGVIERIDLSFVPATKANGDLRFELYDEDVNMQLSGELQFAEKWVAQINESLKKKK